MPRVIPAIELERRVEEIDELIGSLQRTRAMYEEMLGYAIEVEGVHAAQDDDRDSLPVEGEGGEPDESIEAGVPRVDDEGSTADDQGNHVSCPDCFAPLNPDGSCSTRWCGYAEEGGAGPEDEPDPDAREAGEPEGSTALHDVDPAEREEWEELTDYQRRKLVEVARTGSATMQARSRAMLLDAALVELGMDDRVRLLDDGRAVLLAGGYDPTTGERRNGGPPR